MVSCFDSDTIEELEPVEKITRELENLSHSKLTDGIMNRVDQNRANTFKQNYHFTGDISYPGLPAVFDNGNVRWKKVSIEPKLRRCIRFKSTTENSLLRYVDFRRYLDDTVGIAVRFNWGHSFDQYMRKYGINIEDIGYFSTDKLDDIRAVFTAICKNNTVSEEMKSIVSHVAFNPRSSQNRFDTFPYLSNPGVPIPSTGDTAYPGLPAVFDNGKDCWEEVSIEPNLRRCVRFRSTTENSLLRYFDFRGYWDDTIGIAVRFKGGHSFDQYVRKYGINIEDDGCFSTRKLDDIRNIFFVICNNNDIPEAQKMEMRSIIIAGTCLPRPPRKGIYFLLSSVNPFEDSPIKFEQKKQPPTALPYPGKSAVFDQGNGDWNKVFYVSELRRCMRLTSTTEGSLLKYFDLLGYWNGQISLSITFTEGQSFDEYLRKNGLQVEFNGYCLARTIEDVRTAFKIISQNNEIPEEQLKEISAIIERGSCDPSRPPTPPRRFHGMVSLLDG